MPYFRFVDCFFLATVAFFTVTFLAAGVFLAGLLPSIFASLSSCVFIPWHLRHTAIPFLTSVCHLRPKASYGHTLWLGGLAARGRWRTYRPVFACILILLCFCKLSTFLPTVVFVPHPKLDRRSRTSYLPLNSYML